MDKIIEERNGASEVFPELVQEFDRLQAWVRTCVGESVANNPNRWPEE